MGTEAEKRFEALFKKRHPNVEIKHSTLNQDKCEHWDYMLSNPTTKAMVEVKGRKRKNRWDSEFTTDILLETRGVSGKWGWLYGKATYMAFEYELGWILVLRKELVELCHEKTGYEKKDMLVSKSGHVQELYKLCNRRGNQDVTTLITLEDLETIE